MKSRAATRTKVKIGVNEDGDDGRRQRHRRHQLDDDKTIYTEEEDKRNGEKKGIEIRRVACVCLYNNQTNSVTLSNMCSPFTLDRAYEKRNNKNNFNYSITLLALA